MESLAVKYRPTEFKDVLGQELVKSILEKQIENPFNCILLCGPSGDGKTTLARIFANMINKGNGNPIEIDAASNNGVDNVRAIIETAQERALDSEYKVIILDEAHMITTAGWNAFLKCIEEPPKYTVFIFCTTNPEKIPQTILNRMMRLNLTRVPARDIEVRLNYICQQEGFTNYKQSTEYISKLCNGGVRDAISMLNKCAYYSTCFNIETTYNILKNISYNDLFELTNDLIDGMENNLVVLLDKLYDDGKDFKLLVDKLIDFYLDVIKYGNYRSFDNLKIIESYEQELNNIINIENASNYYLYLLNNLMDLKFKIKDDPNIKTTVEVTLIKLGRML